jgi:flagellar hook protein FlgE
MLGSVLHTALSGISAAELAIGVTANNLANAQTDGFKASRAVFADQAPQTLDPGAAPSGSAAGSNPTQVGRGTLVAAIDGDFSQGSIVPGGSPLELAIEGSGFFVLEGPGGETSLTRDGNFHLNANGELVNASGLRVLGYNVDGDYQLDTNNLEPLTIPRGPAAAGADLTGISVGEDGTLQGHFSDGLLRDLGRIPVAGFANPGGLVRRGQNQFSTGSNSGLPVLTNPGQARIVSGARELSNTNLAGELINLSRYSLMYRANLRVLETGDALLEELLNLRRR